jgi:hypothetical protein
MCIHDELVFDFDKWSCYSRRQDRKKKTASKYTSVADAIKSLMESAGDFFEVTTPVEVDRIDTRWSKKKGIEL